MGRRVHPRTIHLPRNGYKHLSLPMTAEERHARNGDKRIEIGYSSTGVPLPSHEELVADYKAHNEARKKSPQKNPDHIKMIPVGFK